jgi:endonuclease/exonuclease/phosphatase family metal-dependent hydrolase
MRFILIFPIVAFVSIFRLAGHFTEPRLSAAEIHAVVGEPARIAHVPAAARPLRIVTWNIERGVRFNEIAAALKTFNPDVVLLQEVDRGCKRSGKVDVARELAHALGMNWVTGGEFQEIGEANGNTPAVTGQAILSRTPISDPAVIVFRKQSSMRWRFNPFQPRRGNRIALRAWTAGLLVYSLHLESGGGDKQRTSQLKDVFTDQAQYPTANVVIAGDFNNSLGVHSFMFDAFRPAGFVDALGSAPRRTSVNGPHPIDWLFAKGATETTGRVEPVPDASDHYPLIATISWDKPELPRNRLLQGAAAR